jgi:hypothetical protein
MCARLMASGPPSSGGRSCRYAVSRSSVQHAKGKPSASGLVSAAATTAPTCSAVYVSGRPDRGRSSRPGRPAALNRLIHPRTTSAPTPSRSATAGTRSPSRTSHTIFARSTTRAGKVRDAPRRRNSASSSTVIGRTCKATRSSSRFLRFATRGTPALLWKAQ